MKSIRWDRRRNRYVLSDGTSTDERAELAVDVAMDVSLSSLRRALASRSGIAVPPAASLPVPEVYEDISELHKAELAEFESEFVLFSEGDRNRVLFFYVGRKGHLRVHLYVEDSATSDRDIATKTVERLFNKPRDVIQAMHYEDENSEGYATWGLK
jgi:hypothetical protein